MVDLLTDPNRKRMIPINTHYAIYLLAATLWTTAFSMTNKRPLRGNRNLGIIACYVIAVIMLFRVPFASAAVTWAAFGIAGGLLYTCYDLFAHARDKSPDKKPGISPATLVYGQLAWPVMIPEAIEYFLADLGILKSQDSSPEPETIPSGENGDPP